MTDQQIDIVYNRLGDIDPEFAESFINSEDKDKWLIDNEDMLEGTTAYTESYKNLDDLKGDRLEALSKFWMERRGKKLSEDRLEQFIYDHPNIYGEDPDMESAKKDVRDYFAKTDAYYDQFNTSRKEEADRIRRQQEVEGKRIGEDAKKNWGPIWRAITSEYEKQRYINDPNSALFGYDAPKLGDAPNTRWAATGDLVAGALASTADLAPLKATGIGGIVSTALGPSIRFLRDAAHAASDSSAYKKDWQSIITDAGTDLATNATANYLLNFRKGGRVLGQATEMTPNLQRGIQLEKDLANTVAGIEKVEKAEKTGRAMRMAVLDMPESPLKRELLPLVEDVDNVDFQAIGAITERYKMDANPFTLDIRRITEGTDYPAKLPPPTNLAKEALDVAPYTRGEKWELLKSKAKDRLTTGVVGRGVMNEMSNIHDGSTPNLVENALTNKPEYKFKTADPNDEVLIRLWKAKFVPGKNDPLYDDYLEWKRQEEENKK